MAVRRHHLIVGLIIAFGVISVISIIGLFFLFATPAQETFVYTLN